MKLGLDVKEILSRELRFTDAINCNLLVELSRFRGASRERMINKFYITGSSYSLQGGNLREIRKHPFFCQLFCPECQPDDDKNHHSATAAARTFFINISSMLIPCIFCYNSFNFLPFFRWRIEQFF